MPDVILVLGMHRNGTSSVAGTLIKLGGEAPRNLMAGDRNNEKGYFESYSLMNINDEILQSAGTKWSDWRKFNADWYASKDEKYFRNKAKEVFLNEYTNKSISVMKDPRNCKIFPFWKSVISEIGLRESAVIPVRSPLDTALSLETREGMPLAHGIFLWLRHVLDAEKSTRGTPRSIFTWEDFLGDWRKICRKISTDIGVVWPRLSDRTESEIDQFLSRDLRHHASGPEARERLLNINSWAYTVYDALLELATSPDSSKGQDVLDDIREKFDSTAELYGKALIGYELAIEQNSALLIQSKNEKEEVHNQAQASSQRAAELELALSDAAERQRQMQKHIDDLNQALITASTDRDNVFRSLQESEEQLAELRNTLRAVHEEKGRINEDLFALRNSCRDYQDEIGQLKETLERSNAELQNERTSTAAALAERDNARDELNQAHHELTFYRENCASLSANQEALTIQLQQLRDKLVDRDAALGLLNAIRSRSLPSRLRSDSSRDREMARKLLQTGLFDPNYYKNQEGLCAEKVFTDDIDAALHFVTEGVLSGLNPSAQFDTRWYLAQNRDVCAAGVNPLWHYYLFGKLEGRQPTRQ